MSNLSSIINNLQNFNLILTGVILILVVFTIIAIVKKVIRLVFLLICLILLSGVGKLSIDIKLLNSFNQLSKNKQNISVKVPGIVMKELEIISKLSNDLNFKDGYKYLLDIVNK